MSEIFRIRRGIGAYGKLWTGDRPEEGALITFPRIVSRQCQHCGKVTNQFRASVIETTIGSRFRDLAYRDLWLFAGGVGSLPDAVDELATKLDVPVCVTNWSGRVAGAVLIAPEAVVSGRGDIESRQAPSAPPGYTWHCVYSGQTCFQWVLLPSSGEIPDDREIEVICPRGVAGDGRHTCPRCAEKIQTILERGERLDWWHSEEMPLDKLTVHVLGSTSHQSVDSRLTTWTGEGILMHHRAPTYGIAQTVLGYWGCPQSRQVDPGLRFLPDGAACIRPAYDKDGTYLGDECFHTGWSTGGTHRIWHELCRPGDDLVGFTQTGQAWFARSTGTERTGYPVRVDPDGTISWNTFQEFPPLVEVRRLEHWRLVGPSLRITTRSAE